MANIVEQKLYKNKLKYITNIQNIGTLGQLALLNGSNS